MTPVTPAHVGCRTALFALVDSGVGRAAAHRSAPEEAPGHVTDADAQAAHRAATAVRIKAQSRIDVARTR
ncbi:hypothetical protein ACWEKM_33780 [Streptomyces sp. NPDC004752]